jgi:hypothetical protein
MLRIIVLGYKVPTGIFEGNAESRFNFWRKLAVSFDEWRKVKVVGGD